MREGCAVLLLRVTLLCADEPVVARCSSGNSRNSNLCMGASATPGAVADTGAFALIMAWLQTAAGAVDNFITVAVLTSACEMLVCQCDSSKDGVCGLESDVG